MFKKVLFLLQCLLEGFNDIKTDAFVESSSFEIGGFKWCVCVFAVDLLMEILFNRKLTVLRGFRNGCPPEMLRVFLFSCNDVGVCADVCVSLVCGKEAAESSIKSDMTDIATGVICVR